MMFCKELKNTKFRIIDIQAKEGRQENKMEEEPMGVESVSLHFSFMLCSLSMRDLKIS